MIFGASPVAIQEPSYPLRPGTPGARRAQHESTRPAAGAAPAPVPAAEAVVVSEDARRYWGPLTEGLDRFTVRTPVTP